MQLAGRLLPALSLAAAALCCAPFLSAQTIDSARLSVFAPLPEVRTQVADKTSQAKIVLGRMLYFEPRLSREQNLSCNSCHDLARYGVDGKPTSAGFKQQHGDRNSPTVYNTSAHIAQFWDGRAPNLEEQAKGPVLNPVEMALPSGDVAVAVLKSIPDYVAAFKAAFPADRDPVTFANMASAIGAFERNRNTPSRWDRFLRGDQAALTSQEKTGFLSFANAGCHNCHSGALLGGNLYQRLGAVKPYPDTSDTGRFKVTKNDGDKFVFKVPSLRNVAMTGPYFHNGQVSTLDEAIGRMAEYQLGKPLNATDRQAIAVWLKSLTGELPAEYIKAPVLPKSTALTPKPEAMD